MQLVNDRIWGLIVRICNSDITSLVPLQTRGHELKHITNPDIPSIYGTRCVKGRISRNSSSPQGLSIHLGWWMDGDQQL